MSDYVIFANGSDEDTFIPVHNYRLTEEEIEKIVSFIREKKIFIGSERELAAKAANVVVDRKVYDGVFFSLTPYQDILVRNRVFMHESCTLEEFAAAVKGTDFESPTGVYSTEYFPEKRYELVSREESGDHLKVVIREFRKDRMTDGLVKFFPVLPEKQTRDLAVEIPKKIMYRDDLDGFNELHSYISAQHGPVELTLDDFVVPVGVTLPTDEEFDRNEEQRKQNLMTQIKDLVADHKPHDLDGINQRLAEKYKYFGLARVWDTKVISSELSDEEVLAAFGHTAVFKEDKNAEGTLTPIGEGKFKVVIDYRVMIEMYGKNITKFYIPNHCEFVITRDEIMSVLDKIKTDRYEITKLTQPWHFVQAVSAFQKVVERGMRKVRKDIFNSPYYNSHDEDAAVWACRKVESACTRIVNNFEVDRRSLSKLRWKSELETLITKAETIAQLFKKLGIPYRDPRQMMEAAVNKAKGR